MRADDFKVKDDTKQPGIFNLISQGKRSAVMVCLVVNTKDMHSACPAYQQKLKM